MTADHPSRSAAPSGGADALRRPRAEPLSFAGLADEELAAEIELYTDVVLAASESDGPIRTCDLDRVLGIEERTETS